MNVGEQVDQPQFVFALRSIRPGTPEECRVKRFLKELGRKHKLRVSWPEPDTVKVKIRAERRAGELLAEMPKRHGARDGKNTALHDGRPKKNGDTKSPFLRLAEEPEKYGSPAAFTGST